MSLEYDHFTLFRADPRASSAACEQREEKQRLNRFWTLINRGMDTVWVKLWLLKWCLLFFRSLEIPCMQICRLHSHSSKLRPPTTLFMPAAKEFTICPHHAKVLTHWGNPFSCMGLDAFCKHLEFFVKHQLSHST